ncbi:hypothetical protein ACIQU8_30310 [Streptomyces griseus]
MALANPGDAQSFQNQATGRCIDDSSLGFRTWACNDTAFQSWF